MKEETPYCEICEENEATHECENCGFWMCKKCTDLEYGECPECPKPTMKLIAEII
jgi:hypothetical protein